MMDNDVCHIEKVDPSDTPLSPILINFDYGHHPEKETARLQCDMFVDPKNHLKRKLIVTRNGQSFVGKLPSEEESLGQSLFLVRNRITNKARIVFMKSCNLINITKEQENIIREQEKNKKKRPKPSEAVFSPKERLSAINYLRQNFGSKKSKRISELGQRINVDLSGKEEEIKQTVANIDIKLKDINTTNDDGNEEELLKLIPPCNRGAKFVTDVYNINEIINAAERESLKPQAEFLINNGLKDKDEINSYFLTTHYSLLEGNMNIDKVVLLIYANVLHKFYSMSAGDLKKKDLLTAIHPTSRLVAKRVLNDFTLVTKTGRNRPTFYKDKLVCYLIVILLLIADFKISLEKLSSCLKGFGIKKLLQLARVVGVTSVTSFKVEKIYALKVPLPPLPKPKIPKKRSY